MTGLAFGIIKWADKHGLLPKSLLDASPFHTSLVVSNLASIRTNHIYHHCYDFGTSSIVVTMGNTIEVPRSSSAGIQFDKCIPLGVVMDERICSGSYFAQVFKRMEAYLANPELLESPPQAVVMDV